MSALDQLEAFREQAESELNELQRKSNLRAQEEKDFRAEIEQQRSTVREMSRVTREYVEEMRAKAYEAKHSEIAMRARLVCAQDFLRQTAKELEDLSDGLAIPGNVLLEAGLAYMGERGNPYTLIVETRKSLGRILQAIKKLGGKDG